MNRRQLVFLILVNGVVSLAIALGVVWAVEARRPDPEELAALYTPAAQAMATALAVATTQPAVVAVANSALAVATLADAATAVAPTATSLPGEQQTYVVQSGDSLLAIAQRFHVTLDEIMAANQLKDANFVFSGQQLKIPVKGSAGGATTPATPTVANPQGTPAPTNTTTTVTLAVTATVASTPTAVAGIQIQTVDAVGNLLSEAVLIVNNSDVAYNLQGWRLERQNGPVFTFGNVQLFPGSSVWVHSVAGTDTSIALYWDQSAPVWQSGAVARLINPQGETVTSFAVP